ncbi:hypothetical protein SAMN02910297_01662 [Methanobrevibacter olleyae]|uniref:ATPase domain-containing protein n=1 Tax=Methanobrevibacter olleyae TaxID=294671 RepID=A0A1I4K836_METOL|nr:ATP-binding protein [Methanobrevibacter olleyae]SFL74741.1 hypothetical protein SAMN02910297_01662 [Methanobrevibacter olleyae]
MKNLPMGDKQELQDNEFFNRFSEISNFTVLLDETKDSNAPNILLTGLRGVGKTVFLKKIKKLFEKDYLVLYLDFSRAEVYQKNNMSVEGLMNFYYKELIKESKCYGLNTFDKRIEKFFKTNNFKIKDFSSLNSFPIPIIENETNSEELINFVMDLPNKIYEENRDKIKGIIIFIDEFQIIKELDNYLESFLWKFRSFIQEQSNVAYVFSGSMSLQDQLISDIASYGGVFGGRMITFSLEPFNKKTVKEYLSERASNLILTEDAFERFFKCTSGIPAYINFFGRLLPKDIELNENDIEREFVDSISVFSIQLISTWSGLSSREQSIIISLLDGPKRRIDIANILGLTTGSLSNFLNSLQNQGLINMNKSNNLYELYEPMLVRWLKSEYQNKGIYPYRKI